MKNIRINKVIAQLTLVIILIGGLTTFSLANTTAVTKETSTAFTSQNNAAVFRVNGNRYRLHRTRLYAGERVRIVLNGDGYTDLDLFVYDQYGNLVGSKTRGWDNHVLNLRINRSETFTIKVVNRGRDFNDYSLKVLVK